MKDNLPSLYLKCLKKEYDPKYIIYRIFEEISTTLERNEHINSQLSGTTAISAFIVKNNLYVANIGDSRAIMGVKRNNGTYKLNLL